MLHICCDILTNCCIASLYQYVWRVYGVCYLKYMLWYSTYRTLCCYMLSLCCTIYMCNCVSCVLYGTLIHYLIILLYVTFMLHNLYVQLHHLCFIWYINSLPYYVVICYIYVT